MVDYVGAIRRLLHCQDLQGPHRARAHHWWSLRAHSLLHHLVLGLRRPRHQDGAHRRAGSAGAPRLEPRRGRLLRALRRWHPHHSKRQEAGRRGLLHAYLLVQGHPDLPRRRAVRARLRLSPGGALHRRRHLLHHLVRLGLVRRRPSVVLGPVGAAHPPKDLLVHHRGRRRHWSRRHGRREGPPRHRHRHGAPLRHPPLSLCALALACAQEGDGRQGHHGIQALQHPAARHLRGLQAHGRIARLCWTPGQGHPPRPPLPRHCHPCLAQAHAPGCQDLGRARGRHLRRRLPAPLHGVGRPHDRRGGGGVHFGRGLDDLLVHGLPPHLLPLGHAPQVQRLGLHARRHVGLHCLVPLRLRAAPDSSGDGR
mmetsp:Transcript_27867/g.90083  ORF Transcript_27867/g.90083 Transcript_27867/m.90083 type:complete len:367 (+) Transcript_27867:1806-2906(+)